MRKRVGGYDPPGKESHLRKNKPGKNDDIPGSRSNLINGKTNDSHDKSDSGRPGRKRKYRVFNSVASVRIEIQSLHNEFMNGKIDKDIMSQARCNLQLLAELIKTEFIENDVEKLKALVSQATHGRGVL